MLLAIGFASTVVNIPAPAPLPLGFERRSALPMRTQVARLSHEINALFAGPPKQAAQTGKPITLGFYTTWSNASAPSDRKSVV